MYIQYPYTKTHIGVMCNILQFSLSSSWRVIGDGLGDLEFIFGWPEAQLRSAVNSASCKMITKGLVYYPILINLDWFLGLNLAQVFQRFRRRASREAMISLGFTKP